ncbi:MAG: hypothetical protein H0U49_06630 [Parachlamydiaceae bacterium]|nr:hypothetical protein [Parachlamydiaceae bacterium]
MKLKFIDQVIKVTFLFALFIFLALWNDNQFYEGLGIFCGAAWGSVNLLLIKHLLEKFLFTTGKNEWKNYFLLGVKFPLLYFIGYILLSIEDFSAYALMSGFSLFLATTLGVGMLTSLAKNPRQKNSAEKPLVDNCHGK